MSGILRIDLSAIQSNWKQVGAGLAPGVENTAVIKANAYGLGVERVGPALYAVGCRTFFVANLPEALVLNQSLEANAKIFILTGLRPGEESVCIDEGFIPVLSSMEHIRQWVEAKSEAGIDEAKAASSAIKVDTGMHRLGLNENELTELCVDTDLLKRCHPQLFMSHLACADTPEHRLNRTQLSNFNRCIEQVRDVLPEIKFSLANSSGICLGADYHFDLVRPGACLYGVNPTPERPNPMATVVNLRLPIVQIKMVSGPATVGYDARYSIADGETKKLAIAAGGYADGLFNHLTNRGFGFVGAKRVPLVGRVSMDTTVFDVTAVSDADLAAIKEPAIELLTIEHGVDALANEAGTIGYEVLTALGNRYWRQYHERSE